MEGFLASNYIAQFPQAMSCLAGWISEGQLHHREDVRVGMELLPLSLNALFDGSNEGTLIVQITDDALQSR
jgi:NADPH-dependent curcumin reductase CurA